MPAIPKRPEAIPWQPRARRSPALRNLRRPSTLYRAYLGLVRQPEFRVHRGARLELARDVLVLSGRVKAAIGELESALSDAEVAQRRSPQRVESCPSWRSDTDSWAQAFKAESLFERAIADHGASDDQRSMVETLSRFRVAALREGSRTRGDRADPAGSEPPGETARSRAWSAKLMSNLGVYKLAQGATDEATCALRGRSETGARQPWADWRHRGKARSVADAARPAWMRHKSSSERRPRVGS
jgi:hypothetical protein